MSKYSTCDILKILNGKRPELCDISDFSVNNEEKQNLLNKLVYLKKIAFIKGHIPTSNDAAGSYALIQAENLEIQSLGRYYLENQC